MKKASILLGIIIVLAASVLAQKPTERCLPGVPTDWKRPELANVGGTVELADGFTGNRFCNSVVVNIPGAFLDTLQASRAQPLSMQLAAAVFVRACYTDMSDADAALNSAFLKAEDVRQGSGDVRTEYSFKTKSGKVARIFVYFNDLDGLLGVIKMGTGSKANSATARKSR